MITPVTSHIHRGPHPEDMGELKRHGITTILSLQTGAYEMFRGRIYVEDEKAEQAGINVIHVRLDNLSPPSIDQVWRCLEILTRPEKTYVHCKHGVDRTGFIIAAYRVLIQGWPVEVAISEWKRMGFHSGFYFWWPAVFRRRMAEMRRPKDAEVRS